MTPPDLTLVHSYAPASGDDVCHSIVGKSPIEGTVDDRRHRGKLDSNVTSVALLLRANFSYQRSAVVFEDICFEALAGTHVCAESTEN